MPDEPIRDDRRFIAAARHAAQLAVNPSRLMEGENEASCAAADVKHWVRIYSELLAFKQRTLDHLYHDLAEISRPANEEIRTIDVPLIEGEQARYRKRLLFWQARATQPSHPADFYSPFAAERDNQERPPGQPIPLRRVQYDDQPGQAIPALAIESRRRRDD